MSGLLLILYITQKYANQEKKFCIHEKPILESLWIIFEKCINLKNFDTPYDKI